MSLLTKFIENIKENELFQLKDKLLLAVSGGIDSVVLCELCRQAGYDFVLGHCNFQLRGNESTRDEQFVVELGDKYGVQVFITRFDTNLYAASNKLSIQEAARVLRYDWFRQLTEQENKARYTLTAHHGDDNAETVLMNFCRGTGLHGMTGIPAANTNLRRPMLLFSREEITGFAKENQLSFVEDSSNSSSKYTRNLFRNEIIPAIASVYPQVKENLRDNINRFKEIESLYRLGVDAIRKKICREKGQEIHIPVKQLMHYDNRALIFEIISPYGFTEKQITEIEKLADSNTGQYIANSRYRIIRHRHWFIISPVAPVESEMIIIEEKDTRIDFSSGRLNIEKISASNLKTSSADEKIARLDAGLISFPLLLRRWKTGDYFYPLGMKKKKKVARFLIDQKLSKPDKEKVWVLEMNKKIIWVVALRIDDRFKITDQSAKALQLTVV